MKQHQKAKAAGITPGTCSVSKHSTHNKSYLFSDVIGTTAAYISNNDAPIMADALNAMNTHGHTPSEMVALIRELREALQFLIALDDRMNDPEYEESGTYMGAYYAYYKGEYKTWEAAKAALTKTEDFR